MSIDNGAKETIGILISSIKTLIAEVQMYKPAFTPETPGMIMGMAMIQGMEEWAEEQEVSDAE